MKERPILFSGPMVRALLAGTKTQTRRVLKQAAGPSLSVGIDDDAPGVAELSWFYGDGPGHDVHEQIKRVACPHGKPGDRLWVREAWRTTGDGGRCDDMPPRDLQAHAVWYEADGRAPADDCTGKLRPSMFMPRWASRLTLEITGVRVERLQDIHPMDALQEGLEQCTDLPYRWDHPVCLQTAVKLYSELWEQINGPGSWGANPWVWVIDFRRIEQPEAAL